MLIAFLIGSATHINLEATLVKLILFLAVASGATSVGMLMSQISAFLLIGIYAFIVLVVLIISYRSTISILNDKEL